MGTTIHKANYNNSAIVIDLTINYQNILLDNLDKQIRITSSTPSPSN